MEDEKQERSPADVMREMQQEHDAAIAKKDAEIAALKTKHAEEIRDILTGRDANFNKQKGFNDRVKDAAAKIKKNLGIKEN